jgi:hypothetical protein
MVSFANDKFYRSQSFLVDSAKKYFDGHASYNPNYIDKKFIEKNKHIFNQKRGYGYWLWKPYIIRETLKQLNFGDIVFYVDCGNLIINDPNILIEKAKKNKTGILLFKNRDGAPHGAIWKNYQWIKYDCFKKMNCLEERCIQGDQVDGSYIVAVKSPYTLSFFNEYLTYCEDEDILTDIPNKLGNNYEGFKDHRHDQSVLSLMAIKNNIETEESPSEWGNDFRDYKQTFLHHRGII